MPSTIKVDQIQSDTGAVNVSSNLQFSSGFTMLSPTLTTPTISGALTVNAGIKFPATQVTSADANTLDDYEEGTWTPTLAVGGGTLGSYVSQEGYYTKIGNIVRAWCYVSANKGTATGEMSVTGLPFGSSGSQRGLGSVDWYWPGGTGLVNCVAWTPSNGSTQIRLGAITAANADATAGDASWSYVSTFAVISVSIVYHV